MELKIKTPAEVDIDKFMKNSGLQPHELVSREKLLSLFDQYQIPEMKQELSPTGFASDFYTEFSNNRLISPHSVAYFILIEKDGCCIRSELQSQFKSISLVEHYNAYYKYRILKEQEKKFTNGAILGYIMELVWWNLFFPFFCFGFFCLG